MSPSAPFLSPAEAARRLGVSAKALRLYEQHGLVAPGRTPAGWRAYGPAEMAQAAQVAALRALGLSLAQTRQALAGEPQALERALAAHQAALEGRLHATGAAIERLRSLRADLAAGRAPAGAALAALLAADAGPSVAFDLPWPWGGERFELTGVGPLTYIVGPLGSGKTRLARRIAESIPGAAFVDLDRAADGAAAARARLVADPALAARVAQAEAWLAEEGATASDALAALLAALEAEGPTALVVDMVEQGLDEPTQGALIAWLRGRGPGARPLFLMTRSCAILDLAAVGAGEAILLCPANHSPPMPVAPYPGAAGYEAVATCLALPQVRARTEGMIAVRAGA